MFVGITNTPRDYAWGSTTAIPSCSGSRRPGPRRPSSGWARIRVRPRGSSGGRARSRTWCRGGCRSCSRCSPPIAARSRCRRTPRPRRREAGFDARERRGGPDRRARAQLQGRVPQARADLRAERPVHGAVGVPPGRRHSRGARAGRGRRPAGTPGVAARRRRLAARRVRLADLARLRGRRRHLGGGRGRRGRRRAVVGDRAPAGRVLPGRPRHPDLAAAAHHRAAARRGALPAGRQHPRLPRRARHRADGRERQRAARAG